VPEDAHHQRAMEFFARANSQDWQLVTTNASTLTGIDPGGAREN